MTDNADLSLEEVKRRLLTDDGFRKRYHQEGAAEYDERRIQAVASYLSIAIPVLEELERNGFVVPKIGSMSFHYERFDDAIPILMKWAQLIPPGPVWSDILGTISKPWAKDIVGPFLINMYPTTAPKWRSAVARCLPAVVSPLIEQGMLDLLRGIARTDNVWCREQILDALGRLKSAAAEQALCEFRSDDQTPVRLIVAKSLAKFDSAAVVEALRELQRDSERDVAKAAAASLRRIEKKAAKDGSKARVKH
jgi:hypothetical protein